MTEDAPETRMPTVADPPFDVVPTADTNIILRTSDLVDFRVHRGILVHASPFFADMFSLPQPRCAEDVSLADLPIIDVTENSATLRQLLVIIYPFEKPVLSTLTDIVPVLQAALKYDMKWPITHLTTFLTASIPKHPLQVWAVACRSGLEQLAGEAAVELRRCTGSESQGSKLEDMLKEQGLGVVDGVSAGMYSRLRQYVQKNPPSFSIDPPWYKTESTSTSKRAKRKNKATGSSAADTLQKQSTTRLQVIVPQFPAPDALVKCSDDITVEVHKFMMALHTPHLNPDLATVPDHPGDSPHSVYSMDVLSSTLVDVLELVYHGDTNISWDIDRLVLVFTVTSKYRMDRITPIVALMWKRTVATSPFHAYFSAVEHALDRHYIEQAAQETLSLSDVGEAYARSMENVPASAYHYLLQYHLDVSHALRVPLDRIKNTWIKKTYQPSGYSSHNYYDFIGSAQQWLVSRLDATVPSVGPSQFGSSFTVHRLMKSQPSPPWPNNIKSQVCQFFSALCEVEDTLPAALDEAIAKVKLTIDG